MPAQHRRQLQGLARSQVCGSGTGTEARRLAKGVDELREATGGRTANIYQFACGSVAYFAPDAPDFQEAGELKGDALARAVRLLNGSGVQASGRRERGGKHLSHKVNNAV